VCSERYPYGNYEQCIDHVAEEEIESLRGVADYIVNNNTTIDTLYASIEKILSDLNIRR
jgi:dephospho-CoA kinase